jgi:hypothetical protein
MKMMTPTSSPTWPVFLLGVPKVSGPELFGHRVSASVSRDPGEPLREFLYLLALLFLA